MGSPHRQFTLISLQFLLLVAACAPREPEGEVESNGTEGRDEAVTANIGDRDAGESLIRRTKLKDGVKGTGFRRLTARESGIDFVNAWTPPPQYKEMLAFTGAGAALGDYDADGLCDIFLTRPFGGARLYRNLGDLKFTDVTATSGLAGETTWSSGASFADVDGDGDLDLFVCGYDTANRLYINYGDGTFSEEGERRGVDFVGSSVMIAFADYDNDGDL
ncbi:MAG: VCBS repeat-containing protein, partial [Planctomycetales bacterium]|nr:VCBS repeat-containing protein [Planctomycetales bacterium]